MPRKYSPKAQEKVEKVMHEFKEGELKSGGRGGPKVKSRKQAIAIGLSEARRSGAKVPSKRSSSSSKSTSGRKASTSRKSTSARKSTTARKSPARKTSARKSR